MLHRCPCPGGAPGSAPQQWRALAQQRGLLAAAPDDEVLAELLVLQVFASIASHVHDGHSCMATPAHGWA